MNDRLIFTVKKGVFFAFLTLFATMFLINCSDEYKSPSVQVDPPIKGVETKITSYFPDSGGVATRIVLFGENFGTDTSYIKVSVNGSDARVIGSDGKSILAVVPARADTGLVKVSIGKGDDVKTFTYENEFKYHFRRNVSTTFGVQGKEGTNDGPYRSAELRRPWFVLTDNDGAIYSIDEGRGINQDGGLRRAYDGQVTTLKRNFEGPMQSPAAMAFNLAQDTLYLVNNLWNANNMKTDAAVAVLTRASGFSEIRAYIRTTYSRCTAIAVHPTNGDIFFNSREDGYIYRYNKKTQEHEPQFRVNNSSGFDLKLLFSRDGKNMFISIHDRHCIYKADYNESTRKLENPTLWIGAWDQSGFKNGQGINARLKNPGQPAQDDKGNLYVADKHNHCIRMITPEGIVSTYAGIPEKSGYADGDPLESQFKEPEGVCFGPDMALYVADRGNNVIRRVLVE
ncbi:IPT/TIG domain-containing protein [Dysgonomonas sp. Marseille-P4361]|uniref:IPT/TIG domain-containing protein n=1 Tax=Dysgonomonas sp. Marseille-P4361 TaxID=2161820 RepID=UPI000D558B8A|nr:IPT/TIG domain-containing protein [Dysgonomonas sp. Marseille-P4361]